MLKVAYPYLRAWSNHCRKWEACQRCPLHKTAFKHVLIRGQIPADVLFIGEAPGKTEDTLGRPFIGPAGKVLDMLIEQVQEHYPFTFAISNVIACAPWEDDNLLASLRAPTKDEAASCRPRLEELAVIVQPKVVVALGKIAETYLAKVKSLHPFLAVPHPAYMLRKGGNRSLEFKRAVIEVRKAMAEVEAPF